MLNLFFLTKKTPRLDEKFFKKRKEYVQVAVNAVSNVIIYCNSVIYLLLSNLSFLASKIKTIFNGKVAEIKRQKLGIRQKRPYLLVEKQEFIGEDVGTLKVKDFQRIIIM